jgi:radical SAM protein with 4Fe4S-binding SPASM domain
MSPALNFAYSFPGCTVADTLSVRVGDLAIIPCHRTAYDKFIYGYFDVEDDKIIGIKGANNVHMAIKVLFMNNKNTTYDCDICKYADYCYKGCYGSQFEYNKDPFIPNKSVCEMVKRKIDKTVEIYEKYGVIDKIKELTEYDEEYQRVKHFLKFYKNIKKKENIYDKLS